MNDFLKGISPSLRSKVCDHVFSVMLDKNDIIAQFYITVDEREKSFFLSFLLRKFEIEFVPPEQILIIEKVKEYDDNLKIFFEKALTSIDYMQGITTEAMNELIFSFTPEQLEKN